MSIQTEIAVTQSIVYFIAAVIPIYLTFIAKTKIGKDDRHFKRLTIVFASFILMQGFYHAASFYGYKLLAKGVLEPLSFGILIFFGSVYLINKISVKAEEVRVT
jgi:hypothetical protein